MSSPKSQSFWPTREVYGIGKRGQVHFRRLLWDTPRGIETPMDDLAELEKLAAAAAEWVRWEEAVGGRYLALPPARAPSLPASEPSVADSPLPAPATPGRSGTEQPGSRRERLEVLATEAASCQRCGLSEGRTKSVFSRGSVDAELVFVGEGPGYHEDQQGLPFVGKAGQLLDRMISAMGYRPEEVYVCNVVKCRPPNNRTPKPDEAGACRPYLVGQLEVVAPKAIVALGRCAAENLGCLDREARGWRGRWTEFESIPVLATYHPAFLLRSPEMKRPVWQDLQDVLRKLGRTPPRGGADGR